MKIQNLLEGTIKVPEDVYNGAMSLVCGHIFSMILTYLNSDDGEEYFDNTKAVKDKATEYKAKYGDFKLKRMNYDDDTQGVVDLHGSSLDQRYLKRNEKFKNKKQGIDVIVMNQPREDGHQGLYVPKQVGYAPSIFINTPSTGGVQRLARSPEYIDSVITRLEGTVEHELIHAIQQLGFDNLDMETSHIDDNDNIKDNDAYYGSQEEFDPMVVTHAKEFVAFLKHFKARNNRLSGAEIKQAFLAFTNPSAKPPERVEMETPQFFDTLYRKDKNRWRDAVKKTYQKIKELQ